MLPITSRWRVRQPTVSCAEPPGDFYPVLHSISMQPITIRLMTAGMASTAATKSCTSFPGPPYRSSAAPSHRNVAYSIL